MFCVRVVMMNVYTKIYLHIWRFPPVTGAVGGSKGHFRVMWEAQELVQAVKDLQDLFPASDLSPSNALTYLASFALT